MVKGAYRRKMYAILRDYLPFMILPTLDEAETHMGLWSKNGFSKHRWSLQSVQVEFPHQTASERRAMTNRHVQQVIALNQQITHAE